MSRVFQIFVGLLLIVLALPIDRQASAQTYGQAQGSSTRQPSSSTRQQQRPFSSSAASQTGQTQAAPANYKPANRPNSALAQLIKTLNARASAVKQLNAPVTIKIPGAPKIKGSLQVEFPKRMRLKAGVLGVSEMGVDAGSNEQRFWVWSKMSLPGSPAALYYASHAEYQNSQARTQIPLQPEQIINALGLVTLDPNGQHYGPFPEGKKYIRLFTIENNNGVQETRVLLINVATAAVEQTSVYDQNNKLVAYANASKFKKYGQKNITLPQKIEIHVAQPGQDDFVLKVDLGSYSLNSLYGDPQQMWAMPDARNVQHVDLGKLGN